MADSSDVQDAFAAIIAGAVYPNGTGSAPAFPCGGVKVYPGWPQSAALDKDMRAKKVNVTVFNGDGGKNTTRYMREWRELSRQVATVTATITGSAITFGGTIATPQNVAVLVNGKLYSYGLLQTDTLSTMAAALAQLISVDTAASSVGPVLTVPGVQQVKIGITGQLGMEVRRQEKQFKISIWAPSHDLRVAAAKAIDPVLSELDKIPFSDGTFGRLVFVRDHDVDDPQEGLIYRRDIVFLVDYPTIKLAEGIEVLGITTIKAHASPTGNVYAITQTTETGA